MTIDQLKEWLESKINNFEQKHRENNINDIYTFIDDCRIEGIREVLEYINDNK